ncbi:MAG: alpha/beta hydrolase [Verrucomicrobiales bacterium]|nr:alpha/beta hydrolase [Verrucomicrobiales bacterium]
MTSLPTLTAARVLRGSALVLSLLAPAVFAKTLPQPRNLPQGVRVERDISYIDGGDEAQRLDLYLPEAVPEKPLPLLVYIHGGGWRAGSKVGCPVASYAARGYIVASVEYRFSQKAIFPAQIQDCQAAIRWLRGHADLYHIDPQHVGVVGGSAGGHLSALVGTSGGTAAFPKIGGHQDQSDRVQAVCDIYGPSDFFTVVQQAQDDPNVQNIFAFNTPSDPYSSLIGSRLDDEAKARVVSPVHYLSEDDPPFLILHGDHDKLVPFAQSTELSAGLRGQGVRVWLQKIPGAGHGGPGFNQPAILQLMQNFFDKNLKGEPIEMKLVPEAEVAVEPPTPVASEKQP